MCKLLKEVSVMRRALALLLAVMCAVLPAAAETRLGSLKMAVVNGEVYCITGKSERGQSTIYRLDEDGPEAVYRCPGQAWWLFEMDDRLLLVTGRISLTRMRLQRCLT